jgi:hypothetical protein
VQPNRRRGEARWLHNSGAGERGVFYLRLIVPALLAEPGLGVRAEVRLLRMYGRCARSPARMSSGATPALTAAFHFRRTAGLPDLARVKRPELIERVWAAVQYAGSSVAPGKSELAIIRASGDE